MLIEDAEPPEGDLVQGVNELAAQDVPIVEPGDAPQKSNGGGDALDKIMETTALPHNEDTYFTGLSDMEPVSSEMRDTDEPANLEALIKEAGDAALYTRMINEGNMLEIRA